MTLLKQAMAVLGSVVLVAMAVALVTPKTARAFVATLVQIVPGATTHVGQAESQLVMLICTPSSCRQLFADGTVGASQYTVPAGRTLVLTDMEWYDGHPTNPNQEFCTILAANVSMFSSCSLADGEGIAYKDQHFTTGLLIGAGQMPQISSQEGFAQGYLVPNQ